MLAPTRAVAAELNARARTDRLATANPDGASTDAQVRLAVSALAGPTWAGCVRATWPHLVMIVEECQW